MKTRALACCVWLAVVACSGGGTTSTPVVGPPRPPPTVDPAPPPVDPKPVVVATGTPSTDVIDRKIIFGNPDKTNVQISPDGKYVSWLAPKDGVLNVWVAPADKLADAKPVTVDSTRPVRQYFWAYDKKHLLYLQDKGGDENFHVHRVSVADGKTTDVTPIEGVRAQVIGLSHRKPNQILVGLNDRDKEIHDVWQVDLATGEKKLLVENKLRFSEWKVDSNLAVRMGGKVDPDGTMVLFVPDGKGGWTEHGKIPNEDSRSTRPLFFDKKGAAIYTIDSRGRDTGALFLENVKSKSKKLIYQSDKADVAGVLAHPTENTIQAVVVDHLRKDIIVVDKKLTGDLAALKKIGDGDLSVPSRTLDDKVWIVGLSGDRQPLRYYRYDRKAKKATLLFSTRPELEGKPLARMHPTIIKSRDGLDLVSYLTLPAARDADGDGKADKPGPAILLVHGGPWGRDAWGFNGAHQLYANRGYAVLSVNFRGSTGFGKKFINAGNGEWGKKMHDDLIDATEWLVANGVAPKDKIGIMGGSYGGYATLVGLSMTPDVFACGVDIVGPSNIITLLESVPPYWKPIIGEFRFRVGDWSTPEGKAALVAVSPLTHASKIVRPLLIAQGANDPRVKQAESDQIVKAMQERSIPVTYVLFPDEGHGFARPENNIAFVASAEAFLSAHLGGVYQPTTKEDLAGSTIKIVTGKEGIPGWP
jgi:dipeptidyl aminopeptidase/acylaminoacyl peptidase